MDPPLAVRTPPPAVRTPLPGCTDPPPAVRTPPLAVRTPPGCTDPSPWLYGPPPGCTDPPLAVRTPPRLYGPLSLAVRTPPLAVRTPPWLYGPLPGCTDPSPAQFGEATTTGSGADGLPCAQLPRQRYVSKTVCTSPPNRRRQARLSVRNNDIQRTDRLCKADTISRGFRQRFQRSRGAEPCFGAQRAALADLLKRTPAVRQHRGLQHQRPFKPQ